jgi:hypothetical protein
MKNDCACSIFSHPDLAKFGLGDRCVAVDSLTGAANRSHFRVSIVTTISRRFGTIVQHDGSQVQPIT